MSDDKNPALNVETLGIRKDVREDYDQVLEKLPKLLENEGFGVLTEIDVKATMKKKLDVDFRRYKILGACNPPAAHKVLQAEPEIGLLLPCNVIVYDLGEGRTRVSAFDPLQMAGSGAKPEIQQTAEDIRARLARVIEAV